MSRLRLLRERLGMTQHELSKKSGQHPAWISDFERGARVPWPKARKDIARALGVPVQEIWPELDE